MSKNNTPIHIRNAVSALCKAYTDMGKEDWAGVPTPLRDATVDMLKALLKQIEPLPSPNQDLRLRATYWLPRRESVEVVRALDELERLKNHG